MRKWKLFIEFLVYLRPFFISIGLFALSLLISTLGFIHFENYEPLESFYMSVITLSTVGYSEVRPLSDSGQIFASILILWNIIIFAYAVSTLTYFISNGNIYSLMQSYTNLNKVQQLKNHVIICGYGRYGSEIMDQLNVHNYDYVVVDKKPEIIEKIKNDSPETPYIQGDVTQDDILLKAGIKDASVLIATTSEDISNVYVVITARQLNPDLKIISRGIDQKSEIKLLRAGANSVVLPEQIGGFYMAALVDNPDAVEFFRILTSQTGVSIAFESTDHPSFIPNYSKTIRELNIRGLTGANIIGVKTPEGEYIVNPLPQTIIEPNMELILLGDKSQLEEFKSRILKK